MTSTKRAIRQAMIGEGVWRNALHALLTDAGARSVSALELGQGGDSPIAYQGRFLNLPDATDGNAIRRASTFHQGNRRVETAGPDYDPVPSAGDYLEVLPYDPATINGCINLALQRRCFSLEQDDIEATGDNLYIVGNDPFDVLESLGESTEQQIFDIEELVGGTSGEDDAVYSPWAQAGRAWVPEVANGVLAVRFNPAPQRTFRVTWKRPYDALDAETDETECPLAYIKWATFYELYLMLERRAVADGVSASSYRNMKEAFEADMLHQQKIALTDKFGGRVVQRRARAYSAVAPSHRLR